MLLVALLASLPAYAFLVPTATIALDQVAVTQPASAPEGDELRRRVAGSYSTSSDQSAAACDRPLGAETAVHAVIAAAYGRSETVPATLLTSLDCHHQVAARVARIGGRLFYDDARIGYLYVAIPRTRLAELIDFGGIEQVSLTRAVSTRMPAQLANMVSASDPIQLPQPRIAIEVRRDTPYFPAEEGGLGALRRRFPTADGRGIVVGYADSGLDLIHPSLRLARDARGRIVPKIVDIEPIGFDDRWVAFGPAVRSSNHQLLALGRRWRVPADGSYRIAGFHRALELVDQSRPYAETTYEIIVRAGLLWSNSERGVRVDTDGDGDFTNNPLLRDFGERRDVAWFGERVGELDHRIPFGIKIDAARRRVWLSIHGATHGDTAGTLASSRLSGALFDGAAPSVQLVDVRARLGVDSISGVQDLAAFRRIDTDMVHMSGGPGFDPVAAGAIRRAITHYRKPYVSAVNIPGAIQIGAFADGRVLRENVRVPPPYLPAINIATTSETQDYPSEGAVTTMLAPSCGLQMQSRYTRNPMRPGLPYGYQLGCSGSSTVPYGTGVVASLMSEARRQRIPFDTNRLINAIFTSARPLVDRPAHHQGRGVIDAMRAWDQLVSMAKVDGPGGTLTAFELTRDAGGQRQEVEGYLADWVAPGTVIEDQLWVTRRGGRAENRAYQLSVRLDDGTYELLDERVFLPQGRAVPIRFRARVGSGRHIAFLRLADAVSGTTMLDIPLHTRASAEPRMVAPGVEEYQGRIAPLQSESLGLRMDADAQAARYVMQLPSSGPLALSPISLPGLRTPSEASASGPPLDPEHHVGPMRTFRSLAPNLAPGIQMIRWSSRSGAHGARPEDGPAPDIPIEARLIVERYGIDVAADGPARITVRNRLAAVEGGLEFYDAELTAGDLRIVGGSTLVEHAQTMAPGVDQWRLQISPITETGTPAVAVLLMCESERSGCRDSGHHASIGARGALIVVDRPAPGQWLLVIRSSQRGDHDNRFRLRQALLAGPEAMPRIRLAHGQVLTFRRPRGARTARYAAFRITSLPGETADDSGLRVAMTALDSGCP